MPQAPPRARPPAGAGPPAGGAGRDRLERTHIMAKDRAHAIVPPRQLWQAPVFLLGLAAVVTVGLARPLWHTTDAARLERELAQLRHILASPQMPSESLLPLA